MKAMVGVGCRRGLWRIHGFGFTGRDGPADVWGRSRMVLQMLRLFWKFLFDNRLIRGPRGRFLCEVTREGCGGSGPGTLWAGWGTRRC